MLYATEILVMMMVVVLLVFVVVVRDRERRKGEERELSSGRDYREGEMLGVGGAGIKRGKG